MNQEATAWSDTAERGVSKRPGSAKDKYCGLQLVGGLPKPQFLHM